MAWGKNSIISSLNLDFTIFRIIFILFFLFRSKRLISFYILFEFRLLPIMFIVFGWGTQPERTKARIFLIIYTVLASLPLLLVIIFCSKNISFIFSLYFLISTGRNTIPITLLVFATIGGFLVKFPIFPFHLWLPKAHVEAPVVGSIVLAAILLKLGGYGLLRTLSLISVSPNISPWVIMLSLGGGAIIAILRVRQKDVKTIIAYSSVSHIAIVVFCCLIKSEIAQIGALAIIISHGITSSGLFALVNMPYERFHSRRSKVLKGILTLAPILSLFWFILVIANIAAPPSINLVREIIIIISIYSLTRKSFFYIIILTFFGVVYSLVLYSMPNQPQAYSAPRFFWPLRELELRVLLRHLNSIIFCLFIFCLFTIYNIIKKIFISFEFT